jgi:hypothetical protein
MIDVAWRGAGFVFLGTYLGKSKGEITGSGRQPRMNEDDEETEWRTRDIYTPTLFFTAYCTKPNPSRQRGQAETHGD